MIALEEAVPTVADEDLRTTDPLVGECEDRTPSETALLRAEIAGLRADLRALRETLAGDDRRPAGRLEPPRPPARIAFADRVAVRSVRQRCSALTPYLTAVEGLRPSAWRLYDVPGEVRRAVARGRRRREWAPPHPLVCNLVALLLITAVAFALRGIDLAGIPAGMHGDEAATGLAARQIIDTGWIGVYSGIAGGNPTGIYYLATIPISLIHDPVVAVRLLSAVIGTIAVVAVFFLASRNAGFGSAVIASLLLAFSEWHIQFSRIGFVTGDWPTFVLLGAIALMEGIRSNRWFWWAISGFFISGATYVYNGNGPILLIAGAFVLWTLFGWRALTVCGAAGLLVVHPSLVAAVLAAATCPLLASRRFRDRRAWLNLGSYVVSSLLTLKGMIDFVRAHPHDYFGRGQNLSVFKTDQWRATHGSLSKAHFLVDRYLLFWNRMTFHPIPNGADLSGVTPLIPKATLAIFAVGMLVALVRRPTPLVLLSAAIVVAAPLTSALTDLTLRRALVIIPFLAMLGAVGMVELLRLAIRHSRITGAAAGGLLAASLCVSCLANYTDFFDKTIPSEPVRATFALELRRSCDFMHTLPPDAYVYLYSENWGLGYDVVQLIDPGIRGENRLPKWGGDGTLNADWSHGQPVFLFVGVQAKNVELVKRIYPHGTEVIGPRQGAPLNGPSYVAYIPDDPGS